MSKLALSYLHAESGAPLRALLGLPVVCRVALYAQKAGFTSATVLVPGADLEAVRAALEAETRLTLEWSLSSDPASAAGADVTALGDRVHLTDALKAIRAADAGQALADDAGLVKSALDPSGVMNPGVLLPAEG